MREYVVNSVEYREVVEELEEVKEELRRVREGKEKEKKRHLNDIERLRR